MPKVVYYIVQWILIILIGTFGWYITRPAPENPKPHWKKVCVANPYVGGRVQGWYIPVCDHYDSVWVNGVIVNNHPGKEY